jgi:hypothetical protein
MKVVDKADAVAIEAEAGGLGLTATEEVEVTDALGEALPAGVGVDLAGELVFALEQPARAISPSVAKTTTPRLMRTDPP